MHRMQVAARHSQAGPGMGPPQMPGFGAPGSFSNYFGAILRHLLLCAQFANTLSLKLYQSDVEVLLGGAHSAYIASVGMQPEVYWCCSRLAATKLPYARAVLATDAKSYGPGTFPGIQAGALQRQREQRQF